MKPGRFHCVVGSVMGEEEAEKLRKEFARKKRWLPSGTLIAPIQELADRYNCPHRFSIGKGRHYCVSSCYLKHFVPKTRAAVPVR